MSKEAALALVMGGEAPANVKPSLITGDMNAQNANPELSPEVTPEPAKKVQDGIDSDRFAVLAKKEAKIVKEREDFKRERETFEQERTKLRDYVTKIEAFESKRKTDPVAALREIGFSDTEIFNALAEAEKPKEPTAEEIAERVADGKIKAFKDEQAEIAAAAQKAKEEALVSEYTAKISSEFKSNPEKYEYSNYYGKVAEDLALEFATENAKLNKEVLSPAEIAQAVESYYEEQDKLMSQIKKRQPAQEQAQKDAVKVEPTRTRTITPPVGAPPPAPSKTLSNKTSATVASTVVRRETFEQKKERLKEALRNGTFVPKSA